MLLYSPGCNVVLPEDRFRLERPFELGLRASRGPAGEGFHTRRIEY